MCRVGVQALARVFHLRPQRPAQGFLVLPLARGQLRLELCDTLILRVRLSLAIVAGLLAAGATTLRLLRALVFARPTAEEALHQLTTR
eukprot:CAMPEP_0119523446 /NCGR_PEP_ID=MMETSP1344-20130328/38507_1 /TAXON_ID=236787 /ORGANISM="Florenciella parvula, Strain CCMP2471" /LENGTH=87 /DNA_ID=CAMNT_0007561663 /DNA_START=22 /DNA_END=285 /DNA_ORIENTATION=+